MLRLLLLSLSGALLLSSCFDRQHERAEIRKTVRAYNTALVNRQGKECSKYIDSASVKYYGQMLRHALTSDSATVDLLRFDQKMVVLLARHTLPADKLKRMNGRDLFEELTNISENSGFASEQLDFITITPTQAEAQTVDSAGKRGIHLLFNKEDGIWKLDIPYVTGQMPDGSWKALIAESGLSEHHFLDTLMYLTNSKKASSAVWQPVVR